MSKVFWPVLFLFTVFMAFFSFYRFDTDGQAVVWLVGGLIWLVNAFMSGSIAMRVIMDGRDE